MLSICPNRKYDFTTYKLTIYLYMDVKSDQHNDIQLCEKRKFSYLQESLCGFDDL